MYRGMNLMARLALAGIACAIATPVWAFQETTSQPGGKATKKLDPSRIAPNKDFAEPAAWRLGNTLLNSEVVVKGGEEVGRLEDVVYDPVTGRPLFAVVKSTKPAEVGKFYAVPWSIVHGEVGSSANTGSYHALIDAPRLNDLSSFTANRWPDFENRIWANSTYREYGETPFWNKENEPANAQDDHARWNRLPGRTMRLSALRGVDAKLDADEKVGAIADVAVDPANGRIIYGLIGRRDRYFAVPWSVVSVSADGHSALIRGRADDFRDEVGFQPDRAPDLVGKVLTREIHVRFNTKPYWKNSSEEAP